MEKCVHTEHCCRVHGCKYGDSDCPVWLGYKPQSHPCETCSYPICNEDYVGLDVKDVPKIPYAEFLARREVAYTSLYRLMKHEPTR